MAELKPLPTKLQTAKKVSASQTSSDDVHKSASDKSKRPFDKKLWRFQKYNSQSKIDNWNERRSKNIAYKYYKEINKERANSATFAAKNIKGEQPVAKRKSAKKPHERYASKKEEFKLKKEELVKNKAEKEQKLKEYKKQKMERNKIFNRKTKKGQPKMKQRLEYLLDKIQRSM